MAPDNTAFQTPLSRMCSSTTICMWTDLCGGIQFRLFAVGQNCGFWFGRGIIGYTFGLHKHIFDFLFIDSRQSRFSTYRHINRNLISSNIPDMSSSLLHRRVCARKIGNCDYLVIFVISSSYDPTIIVISELSRFCRLFKLIFEGYFFHFTFFLLFYLFSVFFSHSITPIRSSLYSLVVSFSPSTIISHHCRSRDIDVQTKCTHSMTLVCFVSCLLVLSTQKLKRNANGWLTRIVPAALCGVKFPYCWALKPYGSRF